MIAVSLYLAQAIPKNPFSVLCSGSRHLSATHGPSTHYVHSYSHAPHTYIISPSPSSGCLFSVVLFFAPSCAARSFSVMCRWQFRARLFASICVPPYQRYHTNLCETISSNCWSERGHIDSNGKKLSSNHLIGEWCWCVMCVSEAIAFTAQIL